MITKRKIVVLAFRGVGKNPGFEREQLLVRLGHVGLQFEEDTTIYGFRPTDEAIAEVEQDENIIDRNSKPVAPEKRLETVLKLHIKPLAGGIYDDSAAFLRAVEISRMQPVIQAATDEKEEYPRCTVFSLILHLDEEDYNKIKNRFDQYRRACPLRYELPARGNNEEIRKTDSCNCATFPHFLGVPLPTETGRMEDFVDALSKQGEIWDATKSP